MKSGTKTKETFTLQSKHNENPQKLHHTFLGHFSALSPGKDDFVL